MKTYNNEIKQGVPLIQLSAVNYNPLVLVNQLFEVVKHDTDIKGYWKDENGKLYIDNINICSYTAINSHLFNCHKQRLFEQGEKAVAFKNPFNELVIEYKNSGSVVLKRQTLFYVYTRLYNKQISKLLKNNEGLTIYKFNNGQYAIERYK